MKTTIVAMLSLLTVLPLAAQERYTNAKYNFSVVAPEANWKWSAAKRDDASDAVLTVTGPSGEFFSVAVSPIGNFRISDDWIVEMQRDVRRSAAAEGFRIENFDQRHAGSPIHPSYRYSYVRVAADGRKQFVEGYVGATNRVYTLQYASYKHDLTTAFYDFVSSFQVMDRLEAQRGLQALRTDPAEHSKNVVAQPSNLGVSMAPNSTTVPPQPAQ